MQPLNLVVFGITSNLAQIKLLPAFYGLEEHNLLPEEMRIIGIARSPKTKEEIDRYVKEALQQENPHHQVTLKEDVLQRLLNKIHYLDGHADDPNFYPKLKEYLQQLDQSAPANTIYYLATYPDLYAPIFENLAKNEMNHSAAGWVRLLIEKPIGNDLASAKGLNELLLKTFNEDQIYRLDHYLGKESLQNILTFRFANNIFENLINKDQIDHIQVTALEDYGIGARGGYYDSVGALKDVGQNHLLQMLAFATMNKPMEFSNKEVTKERLNLIKSLVPQPDKIIFGQYEGYRQEENIDPQSQADTYFAFKTEINNERFKGVPIYFRGGKKLKQTVTEITIVFKSPVDTPFTDIKAGITPNILIYRIQPNEGIVLRILTKKVGQTQQLEESYMQYCYRDTSPYLPDAYEKLLEDAINGDQTYFNDAAEVEAQWSFTDPLVAAKKEVMIYEKGSWGPKEADALIEADGRKWLEPSNLFCKI